MNKKIPKSTQRSSRNWCIFFDIEIDDILDFDGWDMENLHYSFYNEAISHKEFNKRILASTVCNTAASYCDDITLQKRR